MLADKIAPSVLNLDEGSGRQGESLAYVMEQMGHHSIRVPVDTYGHLVPGGNRAAVDRLDDPKSATTRNPGATERRPQEG